MRTAGRPRFTREGCIVTGRALSSAVCDGAQVARGGCRIPAASVARRAPIHGKDEIDLGQDQALSERKVSGTLLLQAPQARRAVRVRKHNSPFLAMSRTPGHVRSCPGTNPSTAPGHLRCRIEAEEATREEGERLHARRRKILPPHYRADLRVKNKLSIAVCTPASSSGCVAQEQLEFTGYGAAAQPTACIQTFN